MSWKVNRYVRRKAINTTHLSQIVQTRGDFVSEKFKLLFHIFVEQSRKLLKDSESGMKGERKHKFYY